MNVLTRLKNAYAELVTKRDDLQSGAEAKSLTSWRFGGTGGTFSSGNWVDSDLPGNRYSNWAGDYNRLVGPLHLNSAYMACLGCYMDAFAQAPACLKEKQGQEKTLVEYEKASGDIRRLLDLLESVNDDDDFVTLMDGTLIDYLGAGNAYWLPTPDRTGFPVELRYIPQHQIKPIRPVDIGRSPDPYDPAILYYEYENGGPPQKIPPEDIIHLRLNKNPFRPDMGLGRGAMLMWEIFSDNEATAYGGQILYNMGISGDVWTPQMPNAAMLAAGVTGSNFNPELFNKLVAQARSGGNRGKSVAFDLPLERHETGNSPEKMALDVIRRWPESRVSAVLRVPAQVAGLIVGEDVKTYANYEEAREAFWQDSVIPLMRRMRSQVTRQLIRRNKRYPANLWFGFDYGEVPALQVDEQARDKNVRENFKYGLIDAAEARGQIGLEAKPDDEGRMYKPSPSAEEEEEDPEEAALARMVDSRGVSSAPYVSPLQRITAELALLEAEPNGHEAPA